jgi:hypothetical protein
MDFLEGPRPIGKQQLRPTDGGNTLWRGLMTLGVRGLKKSELLIFSRSPLRPIEKEKKTVFRVSNSSSTTRKRRQ